MFEGRKKLAILLTGVCLPVLLLGLWTVQKFGDVEKEIVSVTETFGGLGGVKAQPFIVTTDPGVTTSSATSTRFIGSLAPSVNNAFDLGLKDLAWRNINASGTVRIATLDVTTCTGCAGSPFPISRSLDVTATDTYHIGAPTSSYKDVFASGTVYIGTGLLPKGNNIVDLGSATLAFKDIHATGTIYTTGGFRRANNERWSTTSTFNFVLGSQATGTNRAFNEYIRVPRDCTIGEVVAIASSTPSTGQATIFDINYQTSMGVGTTTLFTTQQERPTLVAGSLTTTATVPDVITLTKGMFLTVDTDLYGGHTGQAIQIDCAVPIR